MSAASEPTGATPEQIEHFEKQIRPILAQYCYECHSAKDTAHGGLRLDSAAALAAGGDSGPVVNRDEPSASLLLEAISYAPDSVVQMPPEGKMPASAIAKLTAWVQQGAPHPPSSESSVRPAGGLNLAEAKSFWAFLPVQQRPVPTVTQTDWPRQRLDHFVLATMEARQLTPSSEADRATLLRRLSFDLIGLPPTPEEIDAFEADASPDAYERQVDRLLASPHFGERWARLWLDLARYTDKTASWLDSTGHAYLYRDWVVRAMNDDLPYNEFIRRQLATDLMPETGPEQTAALGFLGLSPTYWKELQLPPDIIKVIVADEWEERVDAVSQTFLGLTVACARCHDHKFDPITAEDYYALAGVFASSRMIERPLMEDSLYEPVRTAKAEIAELQKQIAELKKKKAAAEKAEAMAKQAAAAAAKQLAAAPQDETATQAATATPEAASVEGETIVAPVPSEPTFDEQIAALTERITQLTATPHFDAPLAPAMAEESLYVEPRGTDPQGGTNLVYRPGSQDLPLFIRGNPNRPGPVVPRRFLAVLSSDQPRPLQQGSGRLDLADAITQEAAPLAARVIVNRIWLAHFGRGLVTTPSNFGFSGDPPSHPELLDDLAARLIEQGWSLKQLHREMVLSAAYRQSSRVDADKKQRDPQNVWLSRQNRMRLPVEAWRDAMLAVSGQLQLTLGGPSVDIDDAANDRRTIYATIHRREMSTMLLTHDFPDPATHSAGRQPTITALQGLFALNGPLLLEQAETLAARLQTESPGDLTAQIQRAYRLLYSRPATERELQLGREFLESATDESETQNAWVQYAHVLLASNEFVFVD